MATITRVGVTSTEAWSGSGTPGVTFTAGPTGVATGDLLVAMIRHRQQHTNGPGIEPTYHPQAPAGWTLIERAVSSSTGVSAVARNGLAMFAKVHDGDEFPVSFDSDGLADIGHQMRGEMVAYRYGTSPLEVKASTVHTQGVTTPTVTPSADLTVPESLVVQPKLLSAIHARFTEPALNEANGTSIFATDWASPFNASGKAADGDVTGTTIPVPRWDVPSDPTTDWTTIHAVILPVTIPQPRRNGPFIGLRIS